ncbi:CopG family transcriptional regulator [Hydrogenispora ethanolica]|jgi:CopG family transcriptional regulator/antitoxin EndoAI|uniref:CopG family transcriptional regulator n=1 Tax=Hydrogenispora ethanolica TaxID=1082276 RepID=A0A4R1S232_HYDET|nr:ribbon-helix-helix domain-containing protein [Hydrogenispora ethanolica]TCL73211.1 CopG family transcriptional regulator [Hydrogenispora ethanolica]
MQAKRIAVSMPESLLQEVDGIVRRETGNRSAFVREAVLLLIEERRQRERFEKYRIAYQKMGKLNLLLAEDGMEAVSQELESYENYLAKRE